jgi:ABC-2 type transport system ATP-binding protein
MVVELEHVSRRLGSRLVLRDVSFSVPAGQAFGITGANGSGKTVLLRLLAGLDRATSGTVRVAGNDATRSAGKVRRSVGYLPEDAVLYRGITVKQYLNFVGRARGLGRQVRAASIETLLEVVGLERQRGVDLSTLSPGERRRLLMAGALMHEPVVLLLDDPIRSLDGQARSEQLEVLRELRRLGSSIVMTSTRPEDLLEVCDTVAVLRDGSLTWTGDAAAAAALADPRQADAVRVRIEVSAGLHAALTLLSQRRDLHELEVDEDGRTIWLLFTGGQEALEGLLPQLVRADCTVAHFGIERRSAANALSHLFRAA